jgi:predicted RNA-binding protein YlxR (DUF448 family)
VGIAPRRQDEDGEDGTVRRCLVTGARLPKGSLLRCVVGPDKKLYPDVAGRLPGRGLWLQARRDIVAQAVAKHLFARAARASVEVDPRLPDQVEELLARRCGDILGLARRAGQAVAGFVKVETALRAGKVAVLAAASDGAADGRRKLAALAVGRPVVDVLTAGELGAAFGREQAIHAAVLPGRLAELFVAEAARLGGFRHRSLTEPPPLTSAPSGAT